MLNCSRWIVRYGPAVLCAGGVNQAYTDVKAILGLKVGMDSRAAI